MAGLALHRHDERRVLRLEIVVEVAIGVTAIQGRLEKLDCQGSGQRRRAFLLGSASAVAVPTIVVAQTSGKMLRLGQLLTGFPLSPEKLAEAMASSPFRQELRTLGWVEGQNLVSERQWAERDPDRFPAMAEELVRRKVDVIYAPNVQGAVAAARVTKTIPIVFAGIGFPVELGLVSSLARPGGNVTGFAATASPIWHTKLLEFLKTIAPKTVRVAHLQSLTAMINVRGEPIRETYSQMVQPTVRQLGLDRRVFEVRRPTEIEGVLAQMLEWRPQAITTIGDFVTNSGPAPRQIVGFANNNGLASAFGWVDYAVAGGLLAYSGPRWDVMDRRGAYYIDRILRGAKPADLPVEQPTKHDFIINMRTAKTLGLTVPPSLLVLADQVIE